MTAHTRFRVAVAIGALLAPLAVVAATSAPAAATSKHKHEVYMYKMEKSLRLAGVSPDGFGDSPSPSLSCYNGDIALDGMWSIKSVDQYQPPSTTDPDDDPDYPSTETLGGLYNDKRDVYVEASYPDTVDPAKWNFRFDNRAYGDAQVKVFVTCIRGYTEYANGHRHQVKVRTWAPSAFLTSAHAVYSGRTTWDSSGAGWACNSPDEYYVAPGFDLAATVKDHRLVGSYPTNGGRSWAWDFASFDPDPLGDGTGPINPAGGESVTFYGKCIERQAAINGHRHAIVMKHLPTPDWAVEPIGFGDDGYEVSIPLGDPKTVQYSCDTDYSAYSGYKAMVGWFYMTDWWEHNWFFGMEPRPKTRVWQFWNGHSVAAKVRIGVLCINSRTANPTV
ncbi:MAG: hypothetical protein HYU55_18795 [Nocardioides sp.]|nr:hypothetical protein [Nocardioides sp.]